MSVNNFPELFEWCYQHLALVGYSAVVVFVWKSRGVWTDIHTTVKKTVSQIDTLATNHFPHMQKSLQNQDGLLKSVDTHLKTLVEGQASFITPRRPVRRRRSLKK